MLQFTHTAKKTDCLERAKKPNVERVKGGRKTSMEGNGEWSFILKGPTTNAPTGIQTWTPRLTRMILYHRANGTDGPHQPVCLKIDLFSSSQQRFFFISEDQWLSLLRSEDQSRCLQFFPFLLKLHVTFHSLSSLPPLLWPFKKKVALFSHVQYEDIKTMMNCFFMQTYHVVYLLG